MTRVPPEDINMTEVAIDLAGGGESILLSLTYITMVLTRNCHRHRCSTTPTTVGTKSIIAARIWFRRQLWPYFLNVFGDGGGGGQEDGRKLESGC